MSNSKRIDRYTYQLEDGTIMMNTRGSFNTEEGVKYFTKGGKNLTAQQFVAIFQSLSDDVFHYFMDAYALQYVGWVDRPGRPSKYYVYPIPQRVMDNCIYLLGQIRPIESSKAPEMSNLSSSLPKSPTEAEMGQLEDEFIRAKGQDCINLWKIGEFPAQNQARRLWENWFEDARFTHLTKEEKEKINKGIEERLVNSVTENE